MKLSLFLWPIIFTINSSFAHIENCLKDSLTNGDHHHAVAPEVECHSLLKSHHARIEAKSESANITAVGLQNMFYATVDGQTTLMAGTQTKLHYISFIKADERNGRILVFQKKDESGEPSLATFRSDFIGNVAPLSYFSSKDLKGLSNVVLIPEKQELALIFRSEKRIAFVNILADSRYKGEKFDAKIKRFIQGDSTSLIVPKDIVYSKSKQRIFVLDQDRIVVFGENASENASPEKIVNIPGIEKATRIFFDSTEKKLHINTEHQNLLQVNVDQSGNISFKAP